MSVVLPASSEMDEVVIIAKTSFIFLSSSLRVEMVTIVHIYNNYCSQTKPIIIIKENIDYLHLIITKTYEDYDCREPPSSNKENVLKYIVTIKLKVQSQS